MRENTKPTFPFCSCRYFYHMPLHCAPGCRYSSWQARLGFASSRGCYYCWCQYQQLGAVISSDQSLMGWFEARLWWGWGWQRLRKASRTCPLRKRRKRLRNLLSETTSSSRVLLRRFEYKTKQARRVLRFPWTTVWAACRARHYWQTSKTTRTAWRADGLRASDVSAGREEPPPLILTKCFRSCLLYLNISSACRRRFVGWPRSWRREEDAEDPWPRLSAEMTFPPLLAA